MTVSPHTPSPLNRSTCATCPWQVRVYSACRIAEEVRRATGEYLHANVRREGEHILVPSLVRGCYSKLGRSEEELLEWIAQNLPAAAVRARQKGDRGRGVRSREGGGVVEVTCESVTSYQLSVISVR